MSRARKYKIDKKTVDEIRTAHNLTQEQLGNIIGESQQTIAKYEWTAPTIENFCKEFICEPSKIVLSYESEMKNEFLHLYNWLLSYREQCKIEVLNDNGINNYLIKYLESKGYTIEYLDFDKSTIISDIRIRSSGTIIPYIRIHNKHFSTIYSQNDFAEKESQFINLLLSN